MKFVGYLIAFFAVFIFGAGIGGVIQANDTKPPKPETVTKTVTKTKRVAVVPQACRRMARIGDKINRAANDIDRNASRQLDAVSAARAAIAGKFVNDLNKVSANLNQIQIDTLTAVETIANNQLDYQAATKGCLK